MTPIAVSLRKYRLFAALLDLPQNPLPEHEINHLYRVHPALRPPSCLGRIGRLITKVVYLMVLIPIATLFWLRFGAWLGQHTLIIRLDTRVSSEFLYLVALALFAAFAAYLTAISWSGRFGLLLVRRERDHATWESLIVTRIDSQRMVVGFWWAVIRLTWRWYVAAAIIRIVAIITLTGLPFPIFDQEAIDQFTYVATPDVLPRALLAGGFTLILSLLLGMFMAAGGVMNGFFRIKWSQISKTGCWLAFIRFLLVIPQALVGWGLLLGLQPITFSAETPNILRLLLFIPITLVDNGTTAAYGLAEPNGPWLMGYVGVFAVSALIYMGLTWAVLSLSAWAARQWGAT